MAHSYLPLEQTDSVVGSCLRTRTTHFNCFKSSDDTAGKTDYNEGGPVMNYLLAISSKLTTFDQCLDESAIEKELFAVENETPNMDLLTCSSALTNANATQRGQMRSKVESNSGAHWTCTGRHNPSLGLGPLAELFSSVRERHSPKVMLSFEGQLANKHFVPQVYAPNDAPSSVHSAANTHFRPNYAPLVNQVNPTLPERHEPIYGCQFTGEFLQPVNSCTYKEAKLVSSSSCMQLGEQTGNRPKLSNVPVYQEVIAAPNYDSSYGYVYNQNEFEPYLTPMPPGLASNQSCLYSQEEWKEGWYSQNESLTKFTGDSIDVRVNGYVTSEYGPVGQLNQAGHYY